LDNNSNVSVLYYDSSHMQFLAEHCPLGCGSRGEVISTPFLVTLIGLLSEIRRLVSTRILFFFLTIADPDYRTSYSGAVHTTVFTVTTVFEPGAVITVGALSVFDPRRLNIAPIVGGVVGGRCHAGFSLDIPINL